MRYGLCSVDPLHIRLDDLRLSEWTSSRRRVAGARCRGRVLSREQAHPDARNGNVPAVLQLRLHAVVPEPVPAPGPVGRAELTTSRYDGSRHCGQGQYPRPMPFSPWQRATTTPNDSETKFYEARLISVIGSACRLRSACPGGSTNGSLPLSRAITSFEGLDDHGRRTRRSHERCWVRSALPRCRWLRSGQFGCWIR